MSAPFSPGTLVQTPRGVFALACRNGGRKNQYAAHPVHDGKVQTGHLRIVLVEQIERVLNPAQILLPGLTPEVAGDW